jgi:predicted Zn-dependent peptidase
MEDVSLWTLSNGIRIVYKKVPTTKIVHCGFILDIGSRDENPEQLGLAHFWEHMAFKGTKKRKAYHIINRLESVGGELNAYTSKEKICFYASVLNTYFESALELLKDITFDSIFPEKQIDKERKVILEEMAMYYDSPEDAIQDEFDNVVFGNHSLGSNILGTNETINSFERQDFRNFLNENLDAGKIVFSCVGNLDEKKVEKVARKYLEEIPRFSTDKQRDIFNNYHPKAQQISRPLTQSQCAIGRTAYPINHPQRYDFFMLINILGGPGLNSRLNMALREKYGFVYSVDANYSAYLDTGLFAIFFGTEPKQLNRSIKIVTREMRKLKEQKLGVLQLQRAKEQLMGQLAMAEENNTSLMLMLGKSLLDLQTIPSLEDIYSKIRNIAAEDLLAAANEMFDEDNLSYLTFVPN